MNEKPTNFLIKTTRSNIFPEFLDSKIVIEFNIQKKEKKTL